MIFQALLILVLNDLNELDQTRSLSTSVQFLVLYGVEVRGKCLQLLSYPGRGLTNDHNRHRIHQYPNLQGFVKD